MHNFHEQKKLRPGQVLLRVFAFEMSLRTERHFEGAVTLNATVSGGAHTPQLDPGNPCLSPSPSPQSPLIPSLLHPSRTLPYCILKLLPFTSAAFCVCAPALSGWSMRSLLGWGQFVKLAVPGMFMICIEWWTFEIGVFVMGKCWEVAPF